MRMKGFLAVSGKPMRLLVQAVGPRVSHYYDRPWAASEARGGKPRGDRAEGPRPRGGDQGAARIAMHLLQTTARRASTTCVEPVDLGQTPGDIVVLSFADSDLAGLAAAYAAERDRLPSVRLAHLRDLRHPMSIDLWIDKVGAPRQGDRGAGCSAGSIGGATASRRSRRSRASGTSRSPCCPERTATTRASRRLRPCRPTSLRRCSRFSAKAGARICRRCCAASPAMPGANSTDAEPASRAAHAPAICRAKAR